MSTSLLHVPIFLLLFIEDFKIPIFHKINYHFVLAIIILTSMTLESKLTEDRIFFSVFCSLLSLQILAKSIVNIPNTTKLRLFPLTNMKIFSVSEITSRLCPFYLNSLTAYF